MTGEKKMNIIKLWNKNFNEGISSFQIALMGFMILGAILNNQVLILFSMGMCLVGYLEPNQQRYYLKKQENKK